MAKHKHFDAIIAWANGDRVQVKDDSGEWANVTWTPVWETNKEYRVAPKFYSIGDIFIEDGDTSQTKYMLVSVADCKVMPVVIKGDFKGARYADRYLNVTSCTHVPIDKFEEVWPLLKKVEE